MSIIVPNIRLPLDSSDLEAVEIARQELVLPRGQLLGASIYKKSLDARHGKIHKILSVRMDVLGNEDEILDKNQSIGAKKTAKAKAFSPSGQKLLSNRPVIIGFGPAGIFAALVLAQQGYCPLVLEKGPPVSRRDEAVDDFLQGGKLDKDANIQFGEGGAGTYSDGKLTTRISDERCEFVLDTLVKHGAPEEIKMLSKPHIGTDLLKKVLQSIRKEILDLGGEVRFMSEVTDFRIDGGELRSVATKEEYIPCDIAVLAIGHSARETYERLLSRSVFMEAKPFALGVRIEHLQEAINRAMFGKYVGHPELPPAEYMLTAQLGGRACYSFCMCPGGSVIAAASEEGHVVTNGMSFHARDMENANSALVVPVTPNDFHAEGPLAGIEFQRLYEKKAFDQGGGDYRAPCQKVGDFLAQKSSDSFGQIKPTYPCGVQMGDVSRVLPSFVPEILRQALVAFDKKLRGFSAPDALLTAVESRTSSPVRITRKRETMDGVNVKGMIPCGEGAGYAGGIMSAAVDGIRAAERIMAEYHPF